MKTESFLISDKDKLFPQAYSMHDCSFTAALEPNALVLTFDHLENYFDCPSATCWPTGFHKLTIKYHNTKFVNLRLKFGKKEKDFYDTLDPLNEKDLIMYKYAMDSFDQITLDFQVMIKQKLWGGTIEIAPDEIEYVWE